MLRVSIFAITAGLLTGCYEGNPNGPGESALTFVVAADSAPADGATSVRMVAKIPEGARGDQRKVTFTTSAGSLVGAQGNSVTVTANMEGEAVTELRAPSEPGTARLRIAVGSIIREDSVRFIRAAPERIDVDPGKFAISAGAKNEISITAHLRRAVGRVTPGTRIYFHAFRAGTMDSIGQFSVPTLSDSNGQVSVRYTAGSTPYRGLVRIRAAVQNGANPLLAGYATVEIID